jgi:signal transduction histidine kinase
MVLPPATRARYVDAAVAVALAVLAEVEVLSGQVPGPRAAAALLALFMTLPLVVRRRYPLLVAGAVGASFLMNWAVGVDLYNYLATVLAGLIVAYTAAAHLRLSLAAVGLCWIYLAVAVSALRGPSGLLWGAILIGGAGLAGFAIRDRRSHIERLAQLARELELSRDEHALAAAAAERARIARELHDIVAHAVSVMVIQAGAAEQVLDTEPTRARDPLVSIRDSGRKALVELRRLLHVLRVDDSQPALAPQPGLRDLAALAADVRVSGLTVDVQVDGTADELPVGVDVTAYRIVQEALTNVLKHAGATHAQVKVRYLSDAVQLEIVDNGGQRSEPNGHGHGHGLIGMRERALLYGGTINAARQSDGGFAVHAYLPLTAAR